MSMETEHWVCCGGARTPDLPDDTFTISIGDGPHSISVDINGLEERLSGRLPPEYRDLIEIAAYVLAADQAFSRGTLTAVDYGQTWRRNFRFVIPVRNLKLWQSASMMRCLTRTLRTLSDDQYRFTFVHRSTRETEQLTFKAPGKKTLADWGRIDSVILFSGGLDSLTGAFEEIVSHRRRVLLVSHQSATKTQHQQRKLLGELNGRHGLGPVDWIRVEMVKHHPELRKESLQRSRSFLFAAIAAAVAHLADARRIRFYENGVIAMNLPINEHVYGARASKTAHPAVLDGFEQIVNLIEHEPVKFENPYVLMTRAEVIAKLRDMGGKDLIQWTKSCGMVAKATEEHPHCGVCTQCLDRRFAVYTAGLTDFDPETGYAVELFTGRRPKEEDRILATSYLSSSLKWCEIQTPEEFSSRTGEVVKVLPALSKSLGVDEQTALAYITDLYRRHGNAVIDQTGLAFQRLVRPLGRGSLYPDSLICLYGDMGRAKLAHETAIDSPYPAASNTHPEPAICSAMKTVEGGIVAGANSQPMRPLQSINREKTSANRITVAWETKRWKLVTTRGNSVWMDDSKGMRLLVCLFQHRREQILALHLEALAEGEPPVTGPDNLGKAIDLKTRDALRKRREELTELAETARDAGDADEFELRNSELMQLDRYANAAIKPDGEIRELHPELERARDRVRRALSSTFSNIAKQDESLSRHLTNCTRLGYFIRFDAGAVVLDVDASCFRYLEERAQVTRK